MYLLPPPTVANLSAVPSLVEIYPLGTATYTSVSASVSIVVSVHKNTYWYVRIVQGSSTVDVQSDASTVLDILKHGAVAYARCW